MTSFVNMFSPARYTGNDIKAVRMFRAQFGVSRLRPVGGAAAVVQVTGVKVRTTVFISQSCLS